MEPVDPSTGTPTSAPEINPSERWALPRVLFWKVKSKVDFLVSSMHLEFPAVAPLISIDFLPGKKNRYIQWPLKKWYFPGKKQKLPVFCSNSRMERCQLQLDSTTDNPPLGTKERNGPPGVVVAPNRCKSQQVQRLPLPFRSGTIWATKHSCPIEITQKLRSLMATIYSLWN